MLDFSQLHKYREGNRLEAKKAAGGLPRSVWETYSSFANTNGGVILLGVEETEDKSLHVIGLPEPEKLAGDFWNGVNNHRHVNVNILTDRNVRIETADGKRIIVIDVPRAERRDKPVYIGRDFLSGSFRRNGEGDYHCTHEEVRGMLRDQTDATQDLRVLEQLGLDAIDCETVRRYRNRIENIRPNHVWENLDDVTFLQKLGAVGRGGNGNLHPTGAGILMFGFEYEIVKEYPNYFLDFQEHDDETIRWTDRVVTNLGDWSGNIFDFYYRVVHRLSQDVKTPFVLNGDTRVDDTPVHKALREALVNALIHSDYYGRRGLVIHKFRDCVTITNPGGLRVSVEDAIGGGLSDPRNITLTKVFNLLNLGERAGSGIPSIYSVWNHQGWRSPALKEQFNPDRTELSLSFAAREYK
ncbi:MAG: putative DNA binding domain-containing protein [Peptococcaceae bacterium]|jgi:predicted HTH transcriptional regulator|nr:putative DNA binding domain-containing protein [Peptococcaceae bacterium]